MFRSPFLMQHKKENCRLKIDSRFEEAVWTQSVHRSASLRLEAVHKRKVRGADLQSQSACLLPLTSNLFLMYRQVCWCYSEVWLSDSRLAICWQTKGNLNGMIKCFYNIVSFNVMKCRRKSNKCRHHLIKCAFKKRHFSVFFTINKYQAKKCIQ